MKISRALLTGCLGLLLCSCSVVPPAREVTLFQLRESAIPPAQQSVDLTLKIMSIHSSEALNDRRLLVTNDGTSLSALPGARWSSPVRNLLRERLVESMDANGGIARVTSDTASLKSDLELHSVLRNFVGDFSGDTPQAYIRLDATLSDPADRTIIATRRFRVRADSQGESAEQLVDAFSQATDELALELVNWITSATSK